MQGMQQPQQQETSQFLATLFSFCKVLALIVTVLYIPDLHELTREYIATKITANYGADWSYYGVLAWWAGLFFLGYFGLSFFLQSAIILVNTAWIARRF